MFSEQRDLLLGISFPIQETWSTYCFSQGSSHCSLLLQSAWAHAVSQACGLLPYPIPASFLPSLDIFFRYQITIQIQVVPRKLLGYQRELQAKCKPPISKSAYSIIAFYSSSFKNIDNSNNKIPWQFKSAFSCIVNTALLSEVPDTLLHLILEVLRIFGNQIVAKCWTVVTLMTTRGQSLTANDSKASHPGLSFWCWS